jgi:toxin FitB
VTYLVDANVLSEPTKLSPATKVVEWLHRNEREIVVNPIILGEIQFGIHLLQNGRRKRRLQQWFDGGVRSIQCVTWDVNSGLRWAKLLGDLRANGQSMPIKDSLIAATALLHGLTVATRNVGDFARAGVKLFDPFA